MADYKKMYLELFNAITEATIHMQKALMTLVAAQNHTEDMFIYDEDDAE